MLFYIIFFYESVSIPKLVGINAILCSFFPRIRISDYFNFCPMNECKVKMYLNTFKKLLVNMYTNSASLNWHFTQSGWLLSNEYSSGNIAATWLHCHLKGVTTSFLNVKFV